MALIKLTSPRWMDIALKELGVKEIEGERTHAPRIIEYFKHTYFAGGNKPFRPEKKVTLTSTFNTSRSVSGWPARKKSRTASDIPIHTTMTDDKELTHTVKVKVLGTPVYGDEVPWCATFVNWVMTEAGFVGTRSARAKDWAKWGTASVRRYGAIVVWEHHVGFWVDERGNSIRVFGGNQSNQVNEKSFSKEDGPCGKFHGYRWPIICEWSKKPHYA